MFGIMASVFRNATRTEGNAETEYDRRGRPQNRREAEHRRAQEALDELNRYRLGYRL